jgi:adenylosuccinate lyase
MVRGGRDRVLLPAIDAVVARVERSRRQHAGVAMLARTHGQPATPTTLGKEMANVAHRLRARARASPRSRCSARCNGATGNFNAHVAGRARRRLAEFAERFVEGLGVAYNPLTIQIEPHDALAERSMRRAR